MYVNYLDISYTTLEIITLLPRLLPRLSRQQAPPPQTAGSSPVANRLLRRRRRQARPLAK